MSAGVIHASCAPASSSALIVCARVSPVASSTLASNSVTGWPRSRCRCRRTDDHLHGVDAIVDVARAGAETTRADRHRGQRSPLDDAGREQRGTGGRRELDGRVDAVGRHVVQQFDHGRCRVGDEPVGGSHHAATDRHRAGVDVVDVEHIERGARADDVDDRVDGTDLVKVHLRRRDAMQSSFDFGERLERAQRPRLDPWRQRRIADHRDDVGRGAARRSSRRRVRGPWSPRCRPAAPARTRATTRRDRVAGTPRSLRQGRHRRRRATRAPCRRRYPKSSGTTRSPCQHPRRRNTRKTAQAAPKPLSMPTTVTPDAHDACIASSAVTPSSAAP